MGGAPPPDALGVAVAAAQAFCSARPPSKWVCLRWIDSVLTPYKFFGRFEPILGGRSRGVRAHPPSCILPSPLRPRPPQNSATAPVWVEFWVGWMIPVYLLRNRGNLFGGRSVATNAQC